MKIKALISDLDGTLFYGHGDTVFDLTPANKQALQKLQKAGIHFYAASGRMVSFPIEVLKQNGFTDLKASGFNGAVGYDNGIYPWMYAIDKETVKRMYLFLQVHYPSYKSMQIQSLENERFFDDLHGDMMNHYRKQSEQFHLDEIKEYTIADFLQSDREIRIGKFSVSYNDPSQAFEIKEALAGMMPGKCFVTMANDHMIEIVHPSVNKATLPVYLIAKTGLKKEEIAVIGDALNDVDMFDQTGVSFAMRSGEKNVREKADFVVEDVAECVKWILAYNEKNGENK